MLSHSLAWWNVENLFDVFDSPQRPAWLQSYLAGELAGWTLPVLERKVTQLASVIRQMNGGLGPDLLGVCEIENDSAGRYAGAAAQLHGVWQALDLAADSRSGSASGSPPGLTNRKTSLTSWPTTGAPPAIGAQFAESTVGAALHSVEASGQKTVSMV